MKVLKKGFTLVELMVVIAIIGILATGAMTTYTSQTQKARDSNRISDVKIIQSAVEQVFQDTSAYPTGAGFSGVIDDYITGMIPQDPRFNTNSCSTSGATLQSCDYRYATGNLTQYEVTTAFEARTNITAKAANTADGGNNGDRYEVGNAVNTVNTAGINIRR